MFDNLRVFLIYFFQKRDIEKIQQTTKIMKKFSNKQRVIKIENRFYPDER